MTCSESVEYPWYSIIGETESINQGDIIENCPIMIPPRTIGSGGGIDVDLDEFDVIVMSQSCDLENGKVKFALACPVYKIGDFINRNNFYADKKTSLRQGHVIHYQMLHECTITGFECEHLIVDFKRIFSIDYKFLKDFVKDKGARKRLLPPYREWLSQMFARSFMRVGLPMDIPPFEDENETPTTKILKDAGAEEVPEDVAATLQESLEDFAKKIAEKTVELAETDGRNAVQISDIEQAMREIKN